MINDQKHFAREKLSRAIINTNKESFEQYKRMKAQNEKVNRIEQDVADIKSDLNELKSLIMQIIRN